MTKQNRLFDDTATAADDIEMKYGASVDSKVGEIYQLGPHRLLCGDSTKIEDVNRLMGGEKAKLCATDPPYCVEYDGDNRKNIGSDGLPTGGGKDWSAVYREKEILDFDGFYTKFFENALSVLADHSAIYCWHAERRVHEIIAVWKKLNILYHQQIIWVKPSSLMGHSTWRYQHEPCLMGWRQGKQPKHDGITGSTVWEVNWEGRNRVSGNEHPCQKPVELFARPMRKHNKPGDICFEPFCGSGSCLIAAAKEGLRCYAIEVEPIFCDVIRRRWTTYARLYALDAGSGALT